MFTLVACISQAWRSGWSVLCKSCKGREIKTGSWVFKEFSGEVGDFGVLREFAKAVGLEFERECLDKGPRDQKDLLEGWVRELWISGHRKGWNLH